MVQMCPGHIATSCRIGGEGEGRHSPALLRRGNVLIMPGYNLDAVAHKLGNRAIVAPRRNEVCGKGVAQVVGTEISCAPGAAQRGAPSRLDMALAC